MPRRVFIDCVLSDLPSRQGSALFWIGLADAGGRTFSAINEDVSLDNLAPTRRRSRFSSSLRPYLLSGLARPRFSLPGDLQGR